MGSLKGKKKISETTKNKHRNDLFLESRMTLSRISRTLLALFYPRISAMLYQIYHYDKYPFYMIAYIYP